MSADLDFSLYTILLTARTINTYTAFSYADLARLRSTTLHSYLFTFNAQCNKKKRKKMYPVLHKNGNQVKYLKNSNNRHRTKERKTLALMNLSHFI